MKVKEFIKDEVIYKSINLIESPIVSIILPTYCRGDNGLLERAIKSVINQSFTNWELIIVDDGSKDNTREIIEELMKKDNRVVYIRNEFNSGLPALRVNQGIIKARGKYIAYQFDDDEWYENMLQDLYNEIKKKEQNRLVYGKAKFINSLKEESSLGKEFNTILINKANIIPNNAVLHSKDIPYLYGGYNCHILLRRLCDWELWRRWANYIEFIYIDKFVSRVERGHEKSLSMTCNMYKKLVDSIYKSDMTKELSLYNIMEYEIDNNIINEDEFKRVNFKEDILQWYKIHDLN